MDVPGEDEIMTADVEHKREDAILEDGAANFIVPRRAGIATPLDVPRQDELQAATEVHDQHADVDIEDGAVLDTLQGCDCLAFWTLLSATVGRTEARYEVVVSYQHAPDVGNINRHADEAVDALRKRHVWPDRLPVRVFFERDA